MKSIVGVVLAVCLLGVSCISCSESPSDIQRRGVRHYNAGEYSQAVACFREAAEKGDAEAQLNLGSCYDNGRGVEKNNFEAAKWYRKSAEQGNVNAQLNLGCCYLAEENAREAMKWFRKAAEQGSVAGQILLGFCYFSGKGVEKNAREAVKWLRKGIESRKEEGLICSVAGKELVEVMLAEGYFLLGACYFMGEGVAVDKEKAKELWRKAEEQGSENATEVLRKYFNE